LKLSAKISSEKKHKNTTSRKDNTNREVFFGLVFGEGINGK
jgi:hypothetical protein